MYQIIISGASFPELEQALQALAARWRGETRPPFPATAEPQAPVPGVQYSPPVPAPVDGEGSDPDVAPATSVDPDERDAAGLPWDGRIHSSSRARLQDGTWRQKRGVSDTLLAAVTAELRSRLPGGNVAATTPPAPAPQAAAPVPPTPPAAEPAPAFPWGAPPAAEPAPPAVTHPGLIQQITRAIGSGTINHTQVMELLGAHGVGSAAELEKRADAWPAISAALASQHGAAYA